MKPRYDLLALDLDCTLLRPDGSISPANQQAVLRAQQAGVQVVLCTGRNVRDARLFSDRLLRPADWLASSNGADIRRTDAETPLYRDGLDEALCLTLVDLCAQHGSEPSFYTPDTVYYGEQFRQFIYALRSRGHVGVRNFEELAYYRAVDSLEDWRALSRTGLAVDKAILYHLDPHVVDEIMVDAAETGLFELAPSVMFGGALKNVEVNRRGVHKGSALRALAEKLGIPAERTMALGDSDNDIAMLRQAGLGVAMENAAPHVKAAADAVAPHFLEDGVAAAIEHMLFGG